MRLIRHIRADERGATAIVVASMMLLLLGMAALVIDIGFGMNERRQDQTAADISVMAGALEFGSGTDAEIIAAVKSYSRKNLESVYTNAEWDAIWASCVDTGQDDFGSFRPLSDGTTTYDCISIAPGSYLRVRVPNQLVDTTFGKILGVDQLSTNAFAIARVAPNGGGIRPFGLVANAGPGLSCLRTGPAGTATPPCPGPSDAGYADAGNFYIIDSPFFGNDEIGTTRICSGQNTVRYDNNVAIGLDHLISIRDSNPAWPDACGVDTERPNQLYVQTGNGLMLDPGLYQAPTGTYTNGESSLLQQGPFNKRTVGSQADKYHLDNVPLWEFISAGPAGCDATTIGSLATEDAKSIAMTNCLNTPTLKLEGVVGGSTIADSPRLAWVPKFVETTWPAGSGLRTVASFEPVFIHALYYNCNGTMCEMVFTPGEAGAELCIAQGASGNCKSMSVTQLTSFVLRKDMLDPLVVLAGPDGALSLNTASLWR